MKKIKIILIVVVIFFVTYLFYYANPLTQKPETEDIKYESKFKTYSDYPHYFLTNENEKREIDILTKQIDKNINSYKICKGTVLG